MLGFFLFGFGQGWMWRQSWAMDGLLSCVLSAWLIMILPNCYWTEVPMQASAKVRTTWIPIPVGLLHLKDKSKLHV